MKSPTQAQLAFAKEIGLDVPEGVTKKGLSELLTGATEAHRRETYGRGDLPNDVASQTGVSPIPPWRVKALDEFRQKGIRVGSIVSFSGGRIGVVLMSQPKNALQFWVVTLAERRLARANGLYMEHVYTPPATHMHELCAAMPPYKESWSGHTARLLAFLAFAAPKVPPEQKFRNEHGEFWLLSTVTELRHQFNTQPQPATRAEIAEKKNLRYCMACGKARPKWVFGSARTCATGPCIHGPLPEQRHCFKCGALFAWDGAPGGAASLCPGCRSPKK